MRIGLVAYGPRPFPGGIGRYTVELARGLKALAPQAELMLLTAGGKLPFEWAGQANQFPLAGCQRLPGYVTLGNWAVLSAARRLRLDVLHDPTGVTPFAFGAGGARTVVTVHDVFAWAFPGTNAPLETLIYRCWLPRALPKVGTVITDSLASKADIVRYLGVAGDKVPVIYLGVSSNFQPIPLAEAENRLARYRLHPGYILSVGTPDRRRNLARLLRAYALLRGQGECRPLVVVGVRRGRGQPLARELESLDLLPHVVLLGHVDEADLPALYGAADLFVFPSLYEGFGLPPLEAMACGTPVACSSAASLPEVVGEAAVTFDPSNVEAIAGAMRQVLASQDKAKDLRLLGLERAGQFTWQRTARQTLGVYEQALAPESN